MERILLLFGFFPLINGFQCSTGSLVMSGDAELGANSIAARFRAIEKQFVFDRPCRCEFDWKDVFCSRVHYYQKFGPLDAPTVCICRQFDGVTKGCSQFVSRCFRSDSRLLRSRTSRSSEIYRKSPFDQCSCCFNQPDHYCRQLECSNSKPDFGPDANVSCLCFTPNNYPDWICSADNNVVRSAEPKSFFYEQLATGKSGGAVRSVSYGKSWPFSDNVAFINDNSMRPSVRAKEETASVSQWSWIGDRVVLLPMFVVVVLILSALCSFVGVLILFSRYQSRRLRRATNEMELNGTNDSLLRSRPDPQNGLTNGHEIEHHQHCPMGSRL